MVQTSFRTDSGSADERIVVPIGIIRLIRSGFRRYGLHDLFNNFKDSGVPLGTVIENIVSSQYAKVVSQPGDIVIIATGRVGAIAPVKDEVFIPNKQMFILRAHDPSKVHDYLARLQKESTHKQILEMCSGTLIKYMSVSKLKQVRI